MTALKRVGRGWVVVGLFLALPGQGFAKKASAQQAYEGARKAYFSLKDNKAKDESTSCRFSKKLPIQQLLKHAGCHTLNQEEYMLLVRIIQEWMIPELFK